MIPPRTLSVSLISTNDTTHTHIHKTHVSNHKVGIDRRRTWDKTTQRYNRHNDTLLRRRKPVIDVIFNSLRIVIWSYVVLSSVGVSRSVSNGVRSLFAVELVGNIASAVKHQSSQSQKCAAHNISEKTESRT